jgi:hypothetical protein
LGSGHGIYRLRLAFLLLLVWWTVRLGFGLAVWCFLDLVNLPFHEAGHLFLTPFGSTISFLGGTIGQLGVPAGLIAYFLLHQRQPLGSAFCTWWLGENLVNISLYMADARDLDLPLVGGGEHDWNELFFRFGLLGETSVRAISGFTHVVGAFVMVLGLLWWTHFVLSDAQQRRIRERVTETLPWADRLLQ